MKTFGEFNMLNELGDGGVKPYKWRLRYGYPDYLFTFDAVDGEMYRVSVSFAHGRADVGFGKGEIEMGKPDVATNLGLTHALKTMATVMHVTKLALYEAYESFDMTRSYLRFTVGGLDTNKAKKLKLYTAFIKKAWKGAKVQTSTVGFKVKVPDDFYTKGYK